MRDVPVLRGKTLLACLLMLGAGCGGTSGPVADARAEREAAPEAPADRGGDTADAASDADADADAADAVPSPPDASSDVADNQDAPPETGDAADAGPAPCIGETLTAAESAAYFPYKVGARWIFRGTGTSNGVPIGPRLARREITGTKTFGAATASVMFAPEQELNPQTVDEYLEVAAGGVVDHGSSLAPVASGRAGRFAAPYTAIPFPIATCAPFVAFDVKGVSAPDADGDGMPDTVAATATTTLSLEDVAVPVGTFKRALRVETVEDLAVTYSKSFGTSHSGRRTIDWYASEVGLIKRFVDALSVKTTSELIGYAAGDKRAGVVPTGWVAQNLDGSSNPSASGRSAVGFDGKQFLVVTPTIKDTGTYPGISALQATFVASDGTVVSTAPLLDTGGGAELSLAWDGARYLLAYYNGNAGGVVMVVLSAAGEILDGPILVDGASSSPAVVATKDGFLVSYTKGSKEAGTQRNLLNMWLAVVDGHGHPKSRVQPFTTSQQWSAALAKDDAGGVMAVFNTPPATPSPTSPETADILAAARLGSDGHAIDAAPFAIDAVPGAGHAATELVFDGKSFVALWSQRVNSSLVQAHVARIAPGGSLLDGAALTGGGVVVPGSGGGARLARFGSGSFIVWGQRLPNDFFAEGLGGVRFTADGKLLDPGDEGRRWLLADYGVSGSSFPQILWGVDRALVVWATPPPSQQTHLIAVGGALASPW